MTVKELFQLNQCYIYDIPFVVSIYVKEPDKGSVLLDFNGIHSIMRKFGNCKVLEWETYDDTYSVLIEKTL